MGRVEKRDLFCPVCYQATTGKVTPPNTSPDAQGQGSSLEESACHPELELAYRDALELWLVEQVVKFIL